MLERQIAENMICVCHNCSIQIDNDKAIWSWLNNSFSYRNYYDYFKYYVPYCSENCRIADEL